MKKLSLLLVATIAVLAIFFVSSAFTSDISNQQFIYEYFEYDTIAYSEIEYETAINWTALGTTAPVASPCTPGVIHICVVRVEQSLLSTNPLLTLPEKMALFLQGLPGPTGASDYVNNPSYYVYQKP